MSNVTYEPQQPNSGYYPSSIHLVHGRLGDGFVEDWDETLENLKALEFDVILPGHGMPIRDRSHIDHIQTFLADLWEKVTAMKAAGKTPQEVAETIDLTNHGDKLAQLRQKGIDVRAVIRMYQLMEQ